MRVLFMTGSHPRHAFIARILEKSGMLSAIVIEDRGIHIPVPEKKDTKELKELFSLHFKKRRDSEIKFFEKDTFPNVEILRVSPENINSEEVADFISKVNPSLLLSYGVKILSEKIIKSCKGFAWNIHGGLSPRYKGAITHFWPSYFLEPQMTGMTIHELTQNLDGGEIIHQTKAPLIKGDGIHDLACRAVLTMEKDLPRLLDILRFGKPLKSRKQRSVGKLWSAKDWRSEHLKLIYEVYNDRIVDLVLEGKITGREPILFQQFDNV